MVSLGPCGCKMTVFIDRVQNEELKMAIPRGRGHKRQTDQWDHLQLISHWARRIVLWRLHLGAQKWWREGRRLRRVEREEMK